MKLVIKTTWNLKPLAKNDKDPKLTSELKIVERQNKKFINKWKARTDYLSNPKILKRALDEYELLNRVHGLSGRAGYYWWLRSMQDENDPNVKAHVNKIEEFQNQIRNNIQFFEHSISKVPKNIQLKLLKSSELKLYKHFLEKLFAQAKYLLTEPEEKIVNLLTPTSYENWVRMTSGFISKEERETLDENGKVAKKNISELLGLMNSKNKKVRDKASVAFNEILDKYKDVAEAEMNSVLSFRKTQDILRGVTRPDITRHLADDIDTKVIDTLNKTVAMRFDIAKRFYRLKAKLLGLPKLEYHERNVEYGKIDTKYSFEQSAELVFRVISNLDLEMAKIFKSFLEHGSIDAFPKKGKRGGAFCMYWLLSQPSYILLNHNETLNDVLTIAHEFGHGVNNELIKKQEHALNFGTPTSTAEVASTFMEDFVLAEILKTADSETQLAIQMMRLNSDISTVFRQVACYLFEWDLHKNFAEKGYLSYKEIGGLFQKNMSAYMGNAVIQSRGSENWWVYWSHIRTYFYVYSYASGLLISKSLQAAVKKEHKFIKKVKEFLSAGTSASPKDIFKHVGIDISEKTFWNSGLDEIENLLAQTEKLAQDIGKMAL